MQVAERRTVQVAGQETALLHTSMFEGQQAEVDVLFLRGEGWIVRVVCRGCSPAEIDEVCAGIKLAS
jgi:hypothetical protein